MPEVGPRKVPHRGNKESVKTHFRMYMKDSDHSLYEERFSSRSRYVSKDKKKQQSTKFAEDGNRHVNGDKCTLLSSGQPREKESMDGFWEGQCPPEVKDWVEGCQSPSASESSSSLSTRESSSFSGTSEASSLARMEFLQCTANHSARFSDFSSSSSPVPELEAICMQKPTGTDRTPRQNLVQSRGYERRKEQKGQYLFKLRSNDEKIVWNPQSAVGPSLSQQDKEKSDLDRSGPLELDGSVANLEEQILIPKKDQIHTSLEYLDEGFSSDSSSSTHSWASAYSQEFSSESRWQSFDTTRESEDLPIHNDIYSNAACQTEGGGQFDFLRANIENVEFFRQVQPQTTSKEEAEKPSHYDFSRKSSNALRISKVLTEARMSASINRSEGQKEENKEVLFDGQTFHMSDYPHPGYDGMGNATSLSAARFSTLSSWALTNVPNVSGNSGDWKSSYGDEVVQAAPRSLQPETARVYSISQQCSTVPENVTYGKAMDLELGLHTEILDACENNPEESLCAISSEKPVNGSPQIRHEFLESKTNGLIPSSHSTLRVRSREKHPSPPVEKTSDLREPLLPASHTTAGLPRLGAASDMKPLPSVGLKFKHSAAVKEKLVSKPLHGYFRFIEQGGLPCYTFFVNDSDEVFFARAFKPEKVSNQENCDLIYSFHSRRDDGKVNYAWKGWGRKEKSASDLVGKMRVSQGLQNDNNCFSKKGTKETHFVLINASGELSLETQTTSSDNMPHPESVKPVVDEGMSTLFNALVLPASQRKHVYQSATPNSLIVPNLSNGNIASDLRGPDCTEERRLKHGIDVPKQTYDSARLKGPIHQQRKRVKSHTELAAIVIRTSIEVENLNRSKSGNPVQKETVGWGVRFLEKSSRSGWGLKFLGKNSIDNHNLETGLEARETQANPCIKSKEITECDETIMVCRNSQARQQHLQKTESGKEGFFNYTENLLHPGDLILTDKKELEGKNTRLNANVDVTVILPAGDHGLPTGDSDGPTPLVERWRSGGNCDCGGWDLGCGLSIFSTETLMVHGEGENVALTSHDRINWLSPGNPLKIFTQDYRRKVVLGVGKIEAGCFSLRFQPRFSPLQAFATAVAILHEQITHR